MGLRFRLLAVPSCRWREFVAPIPHTIRTVKRHPLCVFLLRMKHLCCIKVLRLMLLPWWRFCCKVL